jgi:hypothetical protein
VRWHPRWRVRWKAAFRERHYPEPGRVETSAALRACLGWVLPEPGVSLARYQAVPFPVALQERGRRLAARPRWVAQEARSFRLPALHKSYDLHATQNATGAA